MRYIGVLFFIIVVSLFVYEIHQDVVESNVREQAQHSWFVKHGCKPYGYDRGVRTFMCDDGVQF